MNQGWRIIKTIFWFWVVFIVPAALINTASWGETADDKQLFWPWALMVVFFGFHFSNRLRPLSIIDALVTGIGFILPVAYVILFNLYIPHGSLNIKMLVVGAILFLTPLVISRRRSSV